MDLFARDYSGGRFVTFGVAHLVTLLVLGVALAVLLRAFSGAEEAPRRRAAVALVAVLWANELGYHAWRIACGTWTVREMLPLHLCSVMVWFGGVAVLTRSRRMYEILYFLGIGGALQALLTPDIGPYGFPHYRFFQCLVSHALIVAMPLWLTVVERFRPTWASLVKAAAVLLGYMVVVFFVNIALGSNYLFVNRKPATRSVLDALPAWPGYLPYLIVMGLLVFVLLHLPFAVDDARRRRAGAMA